MTESTSFPTDELTMTTDRPAPPSQDVVVVNQPGGLLVSGPPGAVDSLVDRLVAVVDSGTVRSATTTAADVVATALTAKALLAEHGQYLRLTPRSLELIKQHGLFPKGDGGSVWGFVRDSKGFAGNLDFDKVSFSPDQLMALQNAAVMLALRTAIAEVQAAVERVENKVDDVLRLLRSERVGDVLGAKRILDPIVERARTDHQISTTDWSAVAGLGGDITQGIEALRAHIRAKLEEADGGWRPGERVDDAERLVDRKGLLMESLALLVVAEHNLGAWHELRITHVSVNEPEHLGWTIEAARAAVAAQIDQDQRLADQLRLVGDRLTTPGRFDGLAPWQRRELSKARTRLDELAAWFANQRTLDLLPLDEIHYPSVKESFRQVTKEVSDVAGALSQGVGDWGGRSLQAVRARLGRIRRSEPVALPLGGHDDVAGELPAGGAADAGPVESDTTPQA